MANTASERCRCCEQRHKPRFLCDQAKAVLDALHARGMSFNMPTLEFPEPIDAKDLGLGLGPGDALVRQLVVQAATVETAGGMHRPALIFTGRSMHGGELPKWLYAGDADDMARLNALVRDMTDLALRTAAASGGGQ